MSKKAAVKKAAAPSFMDTIANNAKVAPTTKAKRVDDSILQNAPEIVKADISKIIAAKKAMKKAKSEITVAEKSIIGFGTTHKDAEAENGRFKKSYKIAGNDNDMVTFVTANKWSFNTDDITEIKEVLGKNADDLMPSSYNVSIKQEIFDDTEEGKAKQKELMELLGDRWNDFFDTTVSYKPVDDFDSRIYELNADKRSDLKVYMKQSKASVRG
jgi:DNA-binding ferritin-like protein (Dps family)